MIRNILAIPLMIVLLFVVNLTDARAQSPKFILPVQCIFPTECYVQSYVDLDPNPQIADHACGVNTYDGHKGTDFRLRNLDLMDKGIPVVAAADGVVTRVRDGVRDVHMKLFGRKLAYRRGAGNFLVLDHGNGWRTLYGHMRKDSIAVKKGARVKAGQRLGLVGMSGLTEFPHLHFEINAKGRVIDPFVGPQPPNDCQGPKNTLWTGPALATLTYRPRFLIGAGFADVPLSREALLYGLHVRKQLSRKAPNIVYHADFAGTRVGDTFRLRIYGPDGQVFAESLDTAKKDAPVKLRLVGRKIAKRPAWPTGDYRGEFILFRDEGGNRKIFIRDERTLTIK